jgi:hypothetical protein
MSTPVPPSDERHATGVESALPSTGARVLAFLAILVGGVCGGLIGFAVTDLQCSGGCGTGKGIGGVVGALVGSLGVAVVAVLALRAMGEWKTIQERGETRRGTTRRS